MINIGKAIQVRINKEEIENAVKKFINKKISEVCKKQKVDVQIKYEIEQAAIEVRAPDYDERIAALERKIKDGELE